MTLPAELAHLGLLPHPEGGWYRETHRSALCTTIDFVLPTGTFSGWHRVRGAEEVWNHHRGGRLALHLLDARGSTTIVLGEHQFSAVVPAGCWQAAEPLDPSWVLVGCTVAPPFTFAGFDLADERLLLEFPEHAGAVERLLRRQPSGVDRA